MLAYNRKVEIYKCVGIALFVTLLVLCCSCGSTERRYTSESYKISGELLESTRVSLRTLCDNGTITPGKCAELKASYENAKTNFIKAGDALIEANRAGNAIDEILIGIKNEIKQIE